MAEIVNRDDLYATRIPAGWRVYSKSPMWVLANQDGPVYMRANLDDLLCLLPHNASLEKANG